MIRLMRNELFKTYHKKSFKIIIFLSIIFMITINLFYKNNYIEDKDYLTTASNVISSSNNLEEIKLNEYIIKSKRNINHINLNKMLFLFYDNYFLLILIIIIYLGSNTISEEYIKGTMKNLLIKPYSRTKILLAKYLSNLLLAFLILIGLMLFQTVIGGIIFKFNSLSDVCAFYNYKLNKVVEMNIFKYLTIKSLVNIPEFIIIYSLSFMLGVIVKNNMVNMIMYGFIILSELINSFIMSSPNKLFNLLLTASWDFNYLVDGSISFFKYKITTIAVIVCISYYLVIMLISIIYFKKNKI
ncbi:MAG: ABC transporter permease [Bacilli bacterium]|nr:ABC transporter permease [Bacilli bacterium]